MFFRNSNNVAPAETMADEAPARRWPSLDCYGFAIAPNPWGSTVRIIRFLRPISTQALALAEPTGHLVRS
ncbi:unnamed protein product [Amoebophrya sp. A25]|nr:unnamed protein product [Amoebophrya sp. A25]|eukprot:GSA25T00015091001.1